MSRRYEVLGRLVAHLVDMPLDRLLLLSQAAELLGGESGAKLQEYLVKAMEATRGSPGSARSHALPPPSSEDKGKKLERSIARIARTLRAEATRTSSEEE